MSLMKFYINHGQGQKENEKNVLKLYQIKNVWNFWLLFQEGIFLSTL